MASLDMFAAASIGETSARVSAVAKQARIGASERAKVADVVKRDSCLRVA